MAAPAMAALFQLAHINVARMRGGWDDPVMAGFVAQLGTVNAIAEASPGFVWRLQLEDDAAAARRVFGDPQVLFNVSTWESVEALRAFSYAGTHLAALRDRQQWFARPESAHLALWWVPAGHRPTLEEGRDRLVCLDRRGPTPEAFTFQQPFPAPSGSGARRTVSG